MEERKTVEIIDEHNINRKATIMCGIDVKGTDYVVYSIERDNDNDNLFVSKLVKNNDGTYNMINIDDSTEKNNLSGIVRSLVEYAVKNENDKVSGDVVLPSGETIGIMNVLINKTQNINVAKTYVTTAKKTATLVGNNYFQISEKPVVESVLEDEVSVSAPVAAEPAPAVVPEAPVASEPVAPILPEAPVSAPAAAEPAPAVTEPVPEPVAPILPETPTANGVVFDASGESNLNAALHEVSDNASIAVPNVEPIREFGVDTPVNAPQTVPVQNPVQETQGPVLTKKAGFANNKFFMVIAVAFFLASCVFLGYEVFRYFQIVK